jgi:hypothetical protein
VLICALLAGDDNPGLLGGIGVLNDEVVQALGFVPLARTRQ